MVRKLTEDITVNDGKGLFDSDGMIESLIVDVNDLPKALMNGEYVRFCAKIPEMVRKLAVLKQGVTSETNALKEEIKRLSGEKEGDADV